MQHNRLNFEKQSALKQEQDYIRDIAEIRSMMERSSRFLSLSGWAGIMAGVYALAGAYIAYEYLHFNPEGVASPAAPDNLPAVIGLAIGILILSICTAVFFSVQNAKKKGQKVWNATSKRLLANMLVPLVAGGALILILLSKELVGLVAPFTLLFYGLALYCASNFTYHEVRILGIVQILLGLISCYLVDFGLLIWAIGFGVVHIIYGVYMHLRYER